MGERQQESDKGIENVEHDMTALASLRPFPNLSPGSKAPSSNPLSNIRTHFRVRNAV